jgi:glutamine amidotransferase
MLIGGRIYHYRTVTPIYEDNFVVPEAEGKIYAIFHARKASGGSATGSPIFSHPLATTTGTQEIFLAHNGSLKGKVPPNSVDSELALKKLAERDSLAASMKELDGMMDTALNLFVLSVDRATRQARLECLNHWKSDPARDLYYSLYKSRMPGGQAVYSSTLEGKAGLKGDPCERGKIVELV